MGTGKGFMVITNITSITSLVMPEPATGEGEFSLFNPNLTRCLVEALTLSVQSTLITNNPHDQGPSI